MLAELASLDLVSPAPSAGGTATVSLPAQTLQVVVGIQTITITIPAYTLTITTDYPNASPIIT